MNSTRQKRLIQLISCIFAGVLMSTANLNATNYYISNSGNDSNTGLTPAQAWNSLEKVNNSAFLPGDSILFQRNGTWRGTLNINESGQKGNHITISSYGSGQRPRILGSVKATDWTQTSKPNVWQSATNIPKKPMNGDNNGTVCFEYNDTTKQGYYMRNFSSDLSDLTEEFQWTWSSGVVYIYSPTDPDTRYSSVEVDQYNDIISLGGGSTSQYITIDGLVLRYAQERCIYAGYPTQKLNGLEIRNCDIAYTGRIESSSAYGILTCFSDLIIENNTFHDHGRRGISYTSYTSKGVRMSNIHIRNNHFYNGYHSTSIDVQILLNGSSVPDTLDGFYFYNNQIYNDTAQSVKLPYGSSANDIFVQGDAVINNIYIYNNVVKGSKARALLVRGGDTIYIANNTFFGMNKGATPWAQIGVNGTKEVVFVNNICYNDLPRSSHSGTNFMAEEPNTRFIERDYNLYYQTDSKQRYIYDRIVGSVGGDGMDWASYMAKDQFDLNSPQPQNPLFIDGYNDLRLTSGSPAVGAGKPLDWITTDILGNPRDPNNPSLGAYEYYTPNPNATDILRFSFTEEKYPAVINSSNHTIQIEVEYGTNLTELVPNIVTSPGASVNPNSQVAQNFTSPVTYLVTSQSGMQEQNWVVNVTIGEQNKAPNVVVDFEPTAYKGMVYTLDASQSTDPDNDPLTFTWTVPDVFDITSTSGSVISLLPRHNANAAPYNIVLNVSDGKNTVKETLEIEVYKFMPNAQRINTSVEEVSDYQSGNEPQLVMDNDMETRWAAQGESHWLTLQVENPCHIDYFEISFFRGESRTTYFDVCASTDNTNWDYLIMNGASSGFSPDVHTFDVSDKKSGKAYKYIKLVGKMNSENDWNSYTEFKAFGSIEGTTDVLNLSENELNVFPTKVTDVINVNTTAPVQVRIINITGSVVYDQYLTSTTNRIPVNYQRGIYFVQALYDGEVISKKIIIQ